MFVYYAGWLNAKAGRLADRSGRRGKMLKSGTVPPKTGRMVSPLLLNLWWKIIPVAPLFKRQRDECLHLPASLCTLFCTHSRYFLLQATICHSNEHKLHQRYPKTEQFIPTKTSDNALKQGVEHTQCYVRAVHNCKNTRLRECLVE